MRCLAMIAMLAATATAQETGIPRGLRAAKGPTCGYGSICQDPVSDLPLLPGVEARNLGEVARPAKLADGSYVLSSLKSSLEIGTGTIYITGDLAGGSIVVRKPSGVVFVQGTCRGTLKLMCPFHVIVGGSFDGEIVAEHNPADKVHGCCGLIVGWFPSAGLRKGKDVETPGGKPKVPAPDPDLSLDDAPRRPGIVARGTMKLTQVAILGTLSGTVDSGGAGLSVHADAIDFRAARIVGGGQVVCMPRFRWADYPALLRNVMDARVEFNPIRDTQFLFHRCDIPKGFYQVTDTRMRPRLNGFDAGNVEIWVKGPLDTPTGGARGKDVPSEDRKAPPPEPDDGDE